MPLRATFQRFGLLLEIGACKGPISGGEQAAEPSAEFEAKPRMRCARCDALEHVVGDHLDAGRPGAPLEPERRLELGHGPYGRPELRLSEPEARTEPERRPVEGIDFRD